MRKFPTDSTPLRADNYVHIDRQEETGQNLCDTDILDIVRRTDEEVKSDNETPDSDAFQPDVTLKEDQSSLQTLISFFEQTTAGEISENTLTTLWKISQQLRNFFFFSKFSFQIQQKILACAHIKITVHVALSLMTLAICFQKLQSDKHYKRSCLHIRYTWPYTM